MGGSFKHNHKIISAASKRQKQKLTNTWKQNFFQTQSQENFSRQMIYRNLQNKLNDKNNHHCYATRPKKQRYDHVSGRKNQNKRTKQLNHKQTWSHCNTGQYQRIINIILRYYPAGMKNIIKMRYWGKEPLYFCTILYIAKVT